jgi:hypothetical protein
MSDLDGLIGAHAGDAADVRPCDTEGVTILAVGFSAQEWRGAERLVLAPPQAEGGPFAELRIAPSGAAAVVAAIGRRRAGSQQPIWQVVRDVMGCAFYVVRGTGIRVKDRHKDSRLVGGTPGLRKEGEYARARLPMEERERVVPGAGVAADGETESIAPMSAEWTTLVEHFRESIAGVEIPSESALKTIKADWCLVISIPRIERLESDGALCLDYIGTSIIRFRDLLKVRDVNGKRAGGRFAYFLARELAHDVFSVHRQRGFRDWLRFTTAMLGCASSLGGLGWFFSQVVHILG